MTLRRPTNAQLLADIRKRLGQGYTKATAERVKRIAARESDPELLRGMADALAEALLEPKSRKVGAPRKNARVVKDGAVDLDAMPARTSRELDDWVRQWAHEGAVCERIHDENKNKGTSIRTLCELHGIGASTYYKWYPADS